MPLKHLTAESSSFMNIDLNQENKPISADNISPKIENVYLFM